MMTVQQFRERFAPLVQWPVVMRQATWLDAEAVEWSLQYPGMLDAGTRAYEQIRQDAERVLQVD
jgi:hypothetical protein